VIEANPIIQLINSMQSSTRVGGVMPAGKGGSVGF
jgi:hypothetical protein